MGRIIVVCEGQTEQSFCNDVLQPSFNRKGIYLQNPTIKKTGGGIVNWEALKNQITRHLLGDTTAYVTTLIDYYGIHAHHNYPSWMETEALPDKNQRIELIENAMSLDLQPNLGSRFIPYIQLHEFEGLLFSDQEVFDNNFEMREFLDYNYLVDTIKNHPNPELINDGQDTAPSKRLNKIIKDYNYNKVVYGSLLAEEIGLKKIRDKCPRFNNWVSKLENI